MTKNWTPWVISKASLSSEESREAGPLLILRMFWYFGHDLRWRIQASGKYQTDGEILALLLQSITWAHLRASLKALNAFHLVAMPLFPGTRLSVKPVSAWGKDSSVEVLTVHLSTNCKVLFKSRCLANHTQRALCWPHWGISADTKPSTPNVPKY